MRIVHLVILAVFACSGLGVASAQTLGYYQTPALKDDTLVFSSEGDLWRASVAGGVATRLTTHPEAEGFPKISPDGNWIAFEARYDGPLEIYIMPVTGGEPTRLTHEGGSVAVRGWTDNNHVIYRSSNVPGTTSRVLRIIDRTTKAVEELPLADADAVTALSGGAIAFTRYGLSLFSDNAVQYRGGRMAQLWRYTPGTDQEATRLAADFGAPIRTPMAWNGRVYFITDKSGTDNIWSVDEAGSDPVQHTASTTWQMRAPYLDNGRIVYSSGADLHVYDIAANQTSPVNLRLRSDSDAKRARWLAAPLAFLEDARLSPAGDAVTLTARGRFVTAFTGLRRRVEYQLPDIARARSAALGADGKWLYAIVDSGLKGEIWQFPADGSGAGKAVATNLDAYVWYLSPAPKGNAVLYSDKRGRLFDLDPVTGKSTLIDTTASSSDNAFGAFAWSADGRYFAYTFYDARDIAQIALYDTKSGERTVLTTAKYESFSPGFSADGAWLYFLSNRNFVATAGSPWGDRNLGPEFAARTRIYALQLDPAATFPFQAPTELSAKKDEAKGKAEEEKTEAKKGKDKGKAEAPAEEKDPEAEPQAKISLDGVQARLWEVPVRPGYFGSLLVTKGHLFLTERNTDPNVRTASVKRIAIKWESPKVDDFTDGVQQISISADGSKLLIHAGEGPGTTFAIIPASEDFPKEIAKHHVRISDWRLEVSPRDEWRQMALDAWRLHRDFAFDPQLRGVNWDGVRDHFVPLADRLGHRTELNDLLAQMSAELGILHSQIRSGDEPVDAESGQPSFLGATYEPVAGGLKIVSIRKGEADRPDTLGPLSKPGVDAREGDIITAVDGVPVPSTAALSERLTLKANQQVRLDLLRGNSKLSTIVMPVPRGTEDFLLYSDWVQRNRESVAEASDGRIGYLHLRAMGGADIASFARDYYEHFDKDGLIIDVRGNRGGNIDSWIIGTLLRRVWAFWPGANGGPSGPNMQQTFRGHLAVLINEGTYSDGETFAAGVKALELAPLIGTQTAGAGIWLSDRNRLADGGQARVAEFGQFRADGQWMLEGLGTSPDIEVVNPPVAAYRGEDAQLTRALSYLEDKIVAEPIPQLKPGAYPPVGQTGVDVR